MSRRHRRTTNSMARNATHAVQKGQILYDLEGSTIGTVRSVMESGAIALTRHDGGTVYATSNQLDITVFTRKMLDAKGVARISGEFAEVRPYRRPGLPMVGARVFYRVSGQMTGVVESVCASAINKSWVFMRGQASAVDISRVDYSTGSRSHS